MDVLKVFGNRDRRKGYNNGLSLVKLQIKAFISDVIAFLREPMT